MIQLAFSLVLLAAAGELLDAFWKASHADPGFEAGGLMTAKVSLPTARYGFQQQRQFWVTLLEQVRALPHVISATEAAKLPLDPYPGGAYYLPSGAAQTFGPPSPRGRTAQIDAVADKYFETMHIALVNGNSIGAGGTTASKPVAVVSQSIAARFPLHDVVGMQFTFPDYDGKVAEVIGVAHDVRSLRPGGTPAEIVYFPVTQMQGWEQTMFLVVRTDQDPASLVPAIRRALTKQDRDLALGDVRSMEDILGRPLARQRLETGLLAGFAGTALLLAALGLYGLLAYSVATRAPEFTVRFALGARSEQLFLMVVRNGMRLVGLGLAFGVLVLPITLHLLQSAFALGPVRPAMTIATMTILAVCGFCACILPALHATRLEYVEGTGVTLMSIASNTRLWLRAILASRREDTDLQREMAAHIAMEQARLMTRAVADQEHIVRR